MRVLDLQPYRKGRVWFKELPGLLQQDTTVLQRSVAIDSSTSGISRAAALELFLPKGGRALYGLLGAEFIPNTTQTLEVRVEMVTESRVAVPWALASTIDQVYAGILDEYAEGVINGACSSKALNTLGSGILSFRWGAHGMIGSSSGFFRRLSSNVISLLSLDTYEMSEEHLRSLIEIE
jgi:hypothetical protein